MPLARLTSIREYFRVWFYWKNYCIFLFVFIVAIIMGYAYLATPVYESRAKILILPRTGEGFVISSGEGEYRVAPVSQQDINTEIELLTSEQVARDTLTSFLKEGKNPDLRVKKNKWYQGIIADIKKILGEILVFLKLVEPLDQFDSYLNLLRASIEVEAATQSNIIIVTIKAENAKAASVVLNRLLDIYVKHHSAVFTKDEGVEFYRDQANKFQKKLEIAEQKLKDYQKKWHIVDFEKQNQSNIEQISEIMMNLQSVEISMEETEGKIKILKAGLDNGVTITKDMKKIPAIVELEKALVPLYIEKSEILKSYTESSREYRNIDNQITMLKKEIKNEVIKAIATEELYLEGLKTRKISLYKELNQIQRSADEFSQKKKTFEELDREVELLKKNYMLYASKAEDALIFSDRKRRKLANVSIADRAKLPAKPSRPNRLLFLFVSIFIASLSALGLPFMCEFLDHRIKFSQDVEELLKLPVIGSIPFEKA